MKAIIQNGLMAFLMLTCCCWTLLAAPAAAQEWSEGEVLPKTASNNSNAVSTSGNVKVLAGGNEFSFGVIVVVMLVAGFLFLFAEVAIIPGFGLAGITGIVLLLAGLGLAFWTLDLKLAIAYLLASMVALLFLTLWFVYVFPHTKLGKRLVLETKISLEDGYTATRDLEKYVGLEGIATSDLRPSGIARIGEERLDVLSDGEFIPRNTRIKVLYVKNGTLIVGPIETTSRQI